MKSSLYSKFTNLFRFVIFYISKAHINNQEKDDSLILLLFLSMLALIFDEGHLYSCPYSDWKLALDIFRNSFYNQILTCVIMAYTIANDPTILC